MNDSEFIELLNLYLDHEITPADAARLEAEVRNDPERRRTYLEYCRMQKACAILAADFAADRPVPRREPVATGLGWAAAGFASFGVVAAGLAIAFTVWQRPPVASPEVPAVAQTAVRSNGASSENTDARRGLTAATAEVAPARLTLTGATLGLSGGLRMRSHDNGSGSARSGDQLEWLRNFQVAGVTAPEQAATLHFNHSTVPVRAEARQLGLKAQADAAEMTAFRFSK